MIRSLSLLAALVSLSACGTMSMTRESPLTKARHDFSVGGGLVALQTPFKGGNVREEKKPGAGFGSIRFGVTDDVEAMVSGSAFLFAGSTFEIRGKYRWYNQGKYMLTSSAFFTTDNDTAQASSITYTTTGYGVSTSAGYVYSPAFTPYVGAKLMNMTFRYNDSSNRGQATQKTEGVVGAVYGGMTYQFFIFGVPYDTDVMLSLAMLPKEVGNNSLAPYPMLTASFWWRH